MKRRYVASLRSRESLSSDPPDPREKIKDCCRKVVAFMCTQVGVGGLLVGYTLIGAFSFSRIESAHLNRTSANLVRDIRHRYASRLWIVGKTMNVFNESAFIVQSNRVLKGYQDEMVVLIKDGYDGLPLKDPWSFSAALMFSLSIITMIGYGNLVPRTDWGKVATVVYAVFGIPLYVLFFLNVGEILAECFKWIYTKLYECSSKNKRTNKRIVVPSTACLWVMGGYILTGSLMFSNWEKWTFLDSTYFVVTSLCKLGIGDFVPGKYSEEGDETKLVINFVYILVGMGLVAMCYNLMREEIRVKVQEFKEDFNQCLEDTRVKFMVFCKKFRKDEFY